MDYLLFVILAPLAAAAMLVVSFLAWRRRDVGGAGALLWLALAALGWLLYNTLEVLAPTATDTIRFAQLTYLFIPQVPLAWLAFALTFTDRAQWLRSPGFLLLALIMGSLSVLALTNGWHGWVWRTVTPITAGPFLGISVTYGPAFWVFAGVSWLVVIGVCLLMLREYTQSYQDYRRLSVWLVVGALVPVFVNMLYVTRLLPIQKDYSPISFAFGATAFAIGLFRYRLFDLRPVARDVLVDRIHEGMMVLDLDDRLLDFNPAMTRLLGGTPLFRGQPLAEVLPPDQLERLQTQATGEVEIQWPGTGPEDHRYLRFRLSPLTSRADQAVGRLVLAYDITQQRHAELALRLANQALKIRNQELDAFAHTVAHDLKNPIAGLRGIVDILHHDDPDLTPAARREWYDALQHTAEKMHSLVDELLLLAGLREQEIIPTPLDTGAIVTQVLGRLGPMLRDADATVVQPDAWPQAIGYMPWVEEVWINYLSNAIKYGGTPPHLELGADTLPDDQIRFWVRDNGLGLTEEAQGKLFVPFTRLSQAGTEGHGLGLSIVCRILGKLEGSYGVESDGPGTGSLFWFTLPAAPVTTPTPA